MLCQSQQLHAMASTMEEQYLATRYFSHSTLKCMNTKEIISFIIHLRATLNLELLRTGLSQKHLTTELSNTSLPPHGLRNPVRAGEAGVEMLWIMAIASPPSDHAARRMSRGASRRPGTGRNTGTALNKLQLVYPTVLAVTEPWLHLQQMLERSNRDAGDFREIAGLKMLPKNKN